MGSATTQNAEARRANFALGGPLFRRVIPDQRGHVIGHVPLGHDAIQNNLPVIFVSAHVLNIACVESGGLANKVATHD